MLINYSNQAVIKGKKSIFLAGPTPRSEKVLSWRPSAINKLKQLGFDGIIYVPEYEGLQGKDDYTDQAMWEREALTEATIIVFWIPRDLQDMPAYTTNVEFGYWIKAKGNQIIYGRPVNAPKMKYLDWLYDVELGKNPIDNLDELLLQAIKMC